MSDRSFNMHRGLAHRTMLSDLCSHERLLEERLDTGSLIQWVWRGPKQLHLKQVTEIPLGQGPDFENHYYSTWSSVLHHFVWLRTGSRKSSHLHWVELLAGHHKLQTKQNLPGQIVHKFILRSHNKCDEGRKMLPSILRAGSG